MPTNAPRFRHIVSVVILLMLAVPLSAAPAKYVFLMIGDGMGGAQREAASRFLASQSPGTPSPSPALVMDRFPVRGLTTTDNVSGAVTDSAASGTALACGEKTQNGVLGLGPDKRMPLSSIAEKVKAAGRRVGIVSSVSLDHATPAAFYAHVPSRSQYWDIAMQMAASDVDYFGGGQLLGNSDKERKGPASKAMRESPLSVAESKGIKLLRGREGLAECNPAAGRIYAFSDCVDEKSALPFAIDAESGAPTLADFTRAGIEVLDNPEGFFFMIEGGRIDWAGHANDVAASVREVVDFDRAVAVVVDFCRMHADETLIVVTADHETGGLKLKPRAASDDFGPMLAQPSSRGMFEGELQKFATSADWDSVLAAIQKRFRFGTLSATERERLQTAYKRLTDHGKKGRSGPTIARVCTDLVAERAGMSWSTGGHSGAKVVTTAMGVGAARFGGSYDNTDIPKRLLDAMGIAVPAKTPAAP